MSPELILICGMFSAIAGIYICRVLDPVIDALIEWRKWK